MTNEEMATARKLTQAVAGKCDCCKETMHEIDEDRLCFTCALVQGFASTIEEATGLDGDGSVDLACDLVEDLKSRILERLVDRGASCSDFIADMGVGMLRTAQGH